MGVKYRLRNVERLGSIDKYVAFLLSDAMETCWYASHLWNEDVETEGGVMPMSEYFAEGYVVLGITESPETGRVYVLVAVLPPERGARAELELYVFEPVE